MPLNLKELKKLEENLIQFKQIMKIMELSELDKLQKQVAIYSNNIAYFREQKQLIENIEKDTSLSKKSKFFNNESKETKKGSSLFVVISPDKDNEASKIAMRKMRDFVDTLDKENDYFITYGRDTNKLCNRTGMKIIDSFGDFHNNEDSSIKRIVAISTLGIVNLIFKDVYLVFPKIDIEKNELFVTKILPFVTEEDVFSNDLRDQNYKDEFHKTSTSSFFNIKNIKAMQWFPSIDTVYLNLTESLIHLKTNLLFLKLKIIEQEEIVASIKNKITRLEEKIEELHRQIQRSRQEKITLEIINLSAAFKILNKNMEEIRKKEELEEGEEDLLWNKEVKKILEKRK